MLEASLTCTRRTGSHRRDLSPTDARFRDAKAISEPTGENARRHPIAYNVGNYAINIMKYGC